MRRGVRCPSGRTFLPIPPTTNHWAAMNLEEQWVRLPCSALNMGGWYDVFAEGSFACFNGLRQHGGSPAARQSKLIVGPWVHALSISPKVGDVDFGFHSMQDLDALEFRWLEQWLKGIHTGILEEHRCASLSWASTSGGMNMNGPWPAPSGSPGISTAMAMPTPCAVMGGWPRRP